MKSNQSTKTSTKGFASHVYRWRWLTSALTLLAVFVVFGNGMGFVAGQTATILQISDVSDGRGKIDPQMFDPSLDVWFTGEDETLDAYRDIEDRFIAEDFLIVAFEVEATAKGVFDRDALATIERLTDEFLAIPGVRHVRSLTHNPWIRWGNIKDALGEEQGLIISDLVEGTDALTDDGIIERMVAVIGAGPAALRVGESRVREVIGNDADFDNHRGEPLLLGTLINDEATSTAIQIQMTRPYLTEDTQSKYSKLGSDLYSVQYQRAALRAVEHILRREAGLVEPTTAFRRLEKIAASISGGEEKDRLLADLRNPTKAFVLGPDGKMIQKYHEYEEQPDGTWLDRLNPEHTVSPSSFNAVPLSPYTYYVAGIPTFERNFEITGASDAALLPMVWLVVFVGLFVVFRNLAGAVIPMVVVIVSVLGTVGGVFASGHLFNNLTAMLPNMLTVIGVADAVHLVAAYLMLRSKFTDRQPLIVEVIRRNALPVFLTSITTAVGFFSLILIDLAPVQQFGSALAAGALLAYAVTMTLVPLMLSLLPVTRKGRPQKAFGGVFNERRSDRLAAWVVRRKGGLVSTAVVLTVFAVFGATKIQINADPRTMFPEGNQVMLDMQWIEDHLGGTGDLELVFSAPLGSEPFDGAAAQRLETLRVADLGYKQGLADFPPLSAAAREDLNELEEAEQNWRRSQIGTSPQFLNQLDRFEARVRDEMVDPDSALRYLTDLTSPLDVLRKMHQVQNQNKAEYYRVPHSGDVHPESRDPQLRYDEFHQDWWLLPGQDAVSLVSQYYLQYENGARPGENLATQLSPDRRYFRMQGRLAMGSSIEREATYTRILEIAEEEIPGLTADNESAMDVALSGKSMLVDASGLVIAENYTKSIAVALAVIAIFIGLVFRSARFALLSLIPNVFPMLVPISILGFLGISLDGPAIVACSIALGLCVDDTIHLFSKFRDAEHQGLIGEAAIAYGFRECGNALTVTTIVLVFGFLMFATGDFSPNVLTGLLGATMIVVAYIADFLVTPAVFAYSSRRASIGAPLMPATNRV